MPFIAYKNSEKEYVYEVTSYWDEKTKLLRHESKYLGVEG